MGQYGGRNFKKGGGKLESPMNSGNKGILPGGKMPGKSPISRMKGIDSPTTQGNKGVTIEKGFPKSPAKFD